MRVERPDFAWQAYSRRLIRRYPRQTRLSQIFVSVSAQRLYVIRRLQLYATYPVSTSRFGTGTVWGSYRTPTGAHVVAEKIGEGMPLLTRFYQRKASKEIAELNRFACIGERDVITTRILWLAGLEAGRNLGGFFDSRRRCIYIHGTADEKRIGRPSSLGCIRMRNTDVCELFSLLELNTLVYILK